MKTTILISVCLILFLAGCKTNRHTVLAATGTSIGLEIAQNPATEMYQAKLGYVRAELAVIPDNRTGSGASDTADVVMELHYHSIFSLSTSGIYQRLAVGKDAVAQPGAAFMFAKDKNGKLDPVVADSVTKAFQGVPSVNPNVTALKVPLAETYRQATEKTRFDNVAKAAGYASFEAFLIDPKTTPAQVEAIKKGLEP